MPSIEMCFRSIWYYNRNRHAISEYFEIYYPQLIEILCIYSQYLNIMSFALPVMRRFNGKMTLLHVFFSLLTPFEAFQSMS